MRSIAVEAFVIRVGIMILLWSSCLAPAQPQHEVIVTEGGEVVIEVNRFDQATPYYLLAKLLKGKKTIKTPKPDYLGTQCEPRPKSPGFLGSLAFRWPGSLESFGLYRHEGQHLSVQDVTETLTSWLESLVWSMIGE